MLKKQNVNAVLTVVAGIIAAGYIMNMFPDAPVIGEARRGLGG
ncbi:hypothetical protein [Rhodophyticola sp.]|jgi:hypothetical protein